MTDDALKRWICLGCGFSYDEALGLPEHGLPPGTRWRDIPDDWVCPDCGTPKSPLRNGRDSLRRGAAGRCRPPPDPTQQRRTPPCPTLLSCAPMSAATTRSSRPAPRRPMSAGIPTRSSPASQASTSASIKTDGTGSAGSGCSATKPSTIRDAATACIRTTTSSSARSCLRESSRTSIRWVASRIWAREITTHSAPVPAGSMKSSTAMPNRCGPSISGCCRTTFSCRHPTRAATSTPPPA